MNGSTEMQSNMLSQFISGSVCAECRFCCRFSPQSIWEMPLFPAETMEAVRAKAAGPVTFVREGDCFRIDAGKVCGEYMCPFLDVRSGCVLDAETKPFDCRIWPLRVMRVRGEPAVCLTPTCPQVSMTETFVSHVRRHLAADLFAYAQAHPFVIKEYRENFPLICTFSEAGRAD